MVKEDLGRFLPRDDSFPLNEPPLLQRESDLRRSWKLFLQVEFINEPLPYCARPFCILCLDHEPLVRLLYCNMQRSLHVGSVAEKTGVGVQTLHYYERINLLPKPARSEANYRLYSADAVRRVTFIRKAQAVGFTLAEIKEILDLKIHGRTPCRKVTKLGEKHLRAIHARLHQLARSPTQLHS